MTPTPSRRRWPAHVTKYLQEFVIDADEHLDSARRRYAARFGGDRC